MSLGHHRRWNRIGAYTVPDRILHFGLDMKIPSNCLC